MFFCSDRILSTNGYFIFKNTLHKFIKFSFLLITYLLIPFALLIFISFFSKTAYNLAQTVATSLINRSPTSLFIFASSLLCCGNILNLLQGGKFGVQSSFDFRESFHTDPVRERHKEDCQYLCISKKPISRISVE